MNDQTIKGKWTDVKGEIQSQWGKLTHDDLEQTKGNMTSIAGLIQEKYGHAKDEVMAKLNDLGEKFSAKFNDKKDDVTSAAAEKTEDAKTDLRQQH